MYNDFPLFVYLLCDIEPPIFLMVVLQKHYTTVSQINQGAALYIIKPQENARWRVMRYSP